MSLDSRGMRRGGCTEYGCGCTGYDGGVDMKKCTNCFHPPGKHKNLSAANAGSAAGSTASYTSTAHSMGSHATPHSFGNHNFGGNFHPNPGGSHHYNAGGSVQSYQQPSYIQYHHHQPTRPQPQLPQCQANGCFNPVHCDPSLPEGLRAFAYCSPECRDRHLLPLERVNLTVDLDDMKKKLQEEAASEKRNPPSSTGLQRQLSYESSRPGGSSSFTGAGYVLGGHSSGGTAMHNSSSTPVGGGRSSYRATSSSSVPGGGGHHTSGVNGSAGGGRVLGTSSNKPAREQISGVIIAEKPRGELFGVLLSKKVYISDKTSGFLVVGVHHRSPAHSLLQEGKIKIFDVIEKVNDKTCSELRTPAVDPQESFDRYLKDRTSVMLRVSHAVSLPPISKLLLKATGQRLAYTHLIALRYSSDCSEEGYGLTLPCRPSDNLKVTVRGRTVGTPAYHSGLDYGDEIRMYAVVSADGIGDGEKGTELDNDKLDRAQCAKKSVILLILRSIQTKV